MLTKIIDVIALLIVIAIVIIGFSSLMPAGAQEKKEPQVFELPNSMVCGSTRDFIQVITEGKYVQVGQSEEPEWYNMMFYSPTKDFVIAKIYKIVPDITCVALNLDNVELKFNNTKPKTDATWK